jgi:hypothetical protein
MEMTQNNCQDTFGYYEGNIINVINNTPGAGLIFRYYPEQQERQSHNKKQC